MKLARPAVLLGLALAAAGAGTARPDRLRLRAPDLSRPISERLPDPSRPADPVKAAVLKRINEDRAEFGLGPVAWDEAASRAADRFCARQVEERSRGHYLMDGIPPYGRMSFAGVFGVNSENSASWTTSGARFSESIESLALEAEQKMMEEKPPDDGHRQTILDPRATHVGVGYALNHGRFQMSEEFLRRQLQRVTLSAPGPDHPGVLISGKPHGGQRLRFVTVAREPVPRALSREEASGKTSYSYPAAYLALVPEGQTGARVVGMATEDKVRISPGREFSFYFVPDRAGLYTFAFYVGTGGDQPFPGGAATVWVE